MKKKKEYIIYVIAILFFISGPPLLLYFLRNRDVSFFDYYEKEFSGVVVKNSFGRAAAKRITFRNGTIFNISSSFTSDTIKREQLRMKEREFCPQICILYINWLDHQYFLNHQITHAYYSLFCNELH